MNAQERLKDLIADHSQASIEMLWNKIYDVFRFLSDIASLNDNENSSITDYLEHINKNEPNYFQDITVQDDDIDLILKRYMLEAAMLRISMSFDIDPLKNLSVEHKVEVIETIKKCFEEIFSYYGNSAAFLHIKAKNSGVHIYANRVEDRVFDVFISHRIS